MSIPDYDPNPNTGEVRMTGHSGVFAKGAIYHDKDHPSDIIVPVIPAR
jgi:hypothetical protein